MTSDGYIIFQQRNMWLAEGAGQLDVPGGHPEPSVSPHTYEGFDHFIIVLSALACLRIIFLCYVAEWNGWIWMDIGCILIDHHQMTVLDIGRG